MGHYEVRATRRVSANREEFVQVHAVRETWKIARKITEVNPSVGKALTNVDQNRRFLLKSTSNLIARIPSGRDGIQTSGCGNCRLSIPNLQFS